MIAPEPQGVSSGLSLLLRKGYCEVAIGHGDFLQGLKEFKALLSRDQQRKLENEIFRVSSNCTLSSGNHVAHPGSLLLQNIIFTIELLGSQQIALKEKERANADLQKRVEALSAEKREADEKLVMLQADLDRELVAQRSREGELDQLWTEFQATESVLR